MAGPNRRRQQLGEIVRLGGHRQGIRVSASQFKALKKPTPVLFRTEGEHAIFVERRREPSPVGVGPKPLERNAREKKK